MLEHLFPFSYVALLVGLIIGVGITVVCASVFSAVIVLSCILIGMIKITPLLDLSRKILEFFFPSLFENIEGNLRKSYRVSGNTKLEKGKYIFMWYPHGAFSSSMFFHTATEFTEWPLQLKDIRCVALNMVHGFPFMSEIFEKLHIIPSNYHTMKNALQHNSISVSAGGMREMLYEDTALLARRRGIFKMALETGTPLVPVISLGDTKLWEIVKIPHCIQDILEPYDICVPIPTFKSLWKSIGLLQNPLKDPILTVIGEPIAVQQVELPTDAQIAELRSKYIGSLKQMYKKETGRDLTIA
jgi:hypothetical protein